MNRVKLKKAGIDYREGLSRFSGKSDIYESLLLSFLDDTNMESLKTALAAQDAATAFSFAHSLKGGTGNLSMTRMYEALLPLVEQLRAGSLEGIDELFAPVEAAYGEVVTVLQDARDAE